MTVRGRKVAGGMEGGAWTRPPRFFARRDTVVGHACLLRVGRANIGSTVTMAIEGERPTNEVQSVPTLHKEAGYVFEMVMFDCQERRHAHVRGNGKSGAKFWLEPMVEMASPGRYNENELKQISRIIRESGHDD